MSAAWEEVEVDLSEFSSEEGLIGWAAGIFEGEGYIGMRSNGYSTGRSHYPAMVVSSTDHDVLERFAEIVGVGKIYGPINGTSAISKKPMYRWQIGARDDIIKVVKIVWPYLSARRRASVREVFERTKVAA